MRILWKYDKVEDGAMTPDQQSYLDNIIIPWVETWFKDRIGIQERNTDDGVACTECANEGAYTNCDNCDK